MVVDSGRQAMTYQVSDQRRKRQHVNVLDITVQVSLDPTEKVWHYAVTEKRPAHAKECLGYTYDTQLPSRSSVSYVLEHVKLAVTRHLETAAGVQELLPF
jgi:hypothetical protein